MDQATKSRTTLLLAAGMVFSLFSTTTPAAERITHIHTDALGSPVAATDEAGNVIWREQYQPYGERITNDPAALQNQRWYTGHPQDTETGLVYAGARYYDPTLGRFMAVDPVSFTEKNLHSFNRYNYGNNNPYRYVDPDGMASWPTVNNMVRTGGVTGYVGYWGDSRVHPDGNPKFHAGVDILGTANDPIYAYEGGKVVFAGDAGNAGLMVQVEHSATGNQANRVVSKYMHLSRIDVKAGDVVGEGQTIGGMGNSGNARGEPTHLHFEVSSGGKSLDPASQFGYWDRTKQFLRGIFSRNHATTIPQTRYDKVRAP